MTKQANAEDWEDWEDDNASHEAPQAVPADAPVSPLSVGVIPIARFFPGLPTEDDEDEDQDTTSWAWDLKHMEKDLLTLPPLSSKAITSSDSSTCSPSYSARDDVTEGDDSALCQRILVVAEEAANSIRSGRERIVTLEALALVTKLHLLAVRKGFHVELQPGDAELQVPMVIERLHKIAGDWGVGTSVCVRELIFEDCG